MTGKKALRFKASIPDDLDAGIYGADEEITVSFRYGGMDAELQDDFAEAIRETLEKCYGGTVIYCDGKPGNKNAFHKA